MIDSRLKLLSHSSCCLLHSCPRKYQLQKLWPVYEKDATVHTEYGKMFGAGIQAILCGANIQDAIIEASLQWSLDIYDTEKEKSFWHCINAIIKFQDELPDTILSQYKVVYWNGKPASELSFMIELPDRFYYRGYIDILLEHKFDGSLLVVDAKTSGANYISSYKYQNSAQAIGYSIVIDAIRPNTTSFSVCYFEYLTGLNKFVDHIFVKNYLERAYWIRNLLLDIELIKLYSSYDDWPMHGESCGGFGKYHCQFIDTCTMMTKNLVGNKIVYVDPIQLDYDANKDYTIKVKLIDIINSQLEATGDYNGENTTY